MIKIYETLAEDCFLLENKNVLILDKDDSFVENSSNEKVDDFSMPENKNVLIFIDDTKTYQTLDGFGASFTDSSAYLVYDVLSNESKDEVISKLFDENDGIGLTFIRQPIGASDYALSIYSYQDTPNNEDDFDMNHFTISHDEKYILPVLKDMLKINPNIKIMASPWSAPAWMKTTKNMNAGTLRDDCYEVYAKYFAKFIKAYADNGIEIFAITPQNEPLYEPKHYPSMAFSATQEANFIKNYLYPEFQANDIKAKIIAYDHNWDVTEYAKEVLTTAYDCVYGIAWHVYGGEPSAQSVIFDEFPEKSVYFTEASAGEWIAPFENAFTSIMRTSIGSLKNHSKSVVLWNIALDENNGPTVPNFGKSTCRGLLKINQKTKDITYNLDYFALAHFSKYIKQGAIRIFSSDIDGINNVAFKNPDGSTILVLNNDLSIDKDIQISFKDEVISYKSKRKSATTIIWR